MMITPMNLGGDSFSLIMANRATSIPSHPDASAMSGVAFGVVRTAMRMTLATNGVGFIAATPFARRELAACGCCWACVTTVWACVTTVWANYVIGIGGADIRRKEFCH